MLGKLLKYEIKSAGFILPALYVAIGLAFCVGKAADTANISQIATGSAVVSIFAGAAAAILAFITSIMRYHKSMFCEEGYLLQTLPVSKASLLASKVLSTYVWLILGAGAACLGVLSGLTLLHGPSLATLFDLLLKVMPKGFLVFFAISTFVQLFLFIAEIYFSMTLANTAAISKYNVLFSFVFYFVCNTVVGFLELGAMMLIPVGLKVVGGKTTFVFDTTLGSILGKTGSDITTLYGVTLGVGSVFLDALVAIGLLIACNYLLKKKLMIK